MAKEVEKVINIAKHEIGIKESPAGSNKVKYNTKFYGKAVAGANYAWCMVFVWWCFMTAGLSKYLYGGKKIAGCQEFERWAKTKKKTIDKKSGRKGDVVLFDFTHSGHAQHVGIIVDRTATGYKTIEGNTATGNDANGGAVMNRVRSFSQVRTVVRVLPAAASAPSPVVAAAASAIASVKTAATIYVISAVAGVAVRKTPSKDGVEVAKFASGTEVKLVEKANPYWYKVKGKAANGKTVTGYVSRMACLKPKE